MCRRGVATMWLGGERRASGAPRGGVCDGVAGGVARGLGERRASGAPRGALIPEVARIEFEVVSCEEVADFVLEGMQGVVDLLSGDVLANRQKTVVAYAECAVADLPVEVTVLRSALFDPFRRRGFDVFDGLAEGGSAPEL